MYYEGIINLTYEQITNLSDFVNTLKHLQASIIQNDINEIEMAAEQEEKVLHRIKNCEDKRTEAVIAALYHYKIETDTAKALDELADVILAIDPEGYDEFSQTRIILLEKVKEVLLLNTQNEIIINNSRNFIRDLIKNVLGSKRDNFFDRKV